MTKQNLEKLTDNFFARDSETVAVDLLGAKIIRVLPKRKKIEVKIHETEAYGGIVGNLTARRSGLYREPGRILLYHAGFSKKKRTKYNYVFAISTDEEGKPSVVVISGIKDNSEEINGLYRVTNYLRLGKRFDNLNINTKQFYILAGKKEKEIIINKENKKSANHIGTYRLKE